MVRPYLPDKMFKEITDKLMERLSTTSESELVGILLFVAYYHGERRIERDCKEFNMTREQWILKVKRDYVKWKKNGNDFEYI